MVASRGRLRHGDCLVSVALTRILVRPGTVRMAWTVELMQSVIDDLRWFGKRDGRQLLKEALQRLEEDPWSNRAR